MRKTYSPKTRPVQETPIQNVMRRAKLVDIADALVSSTSKATPAQRRAAQEFLDGEDSKIIGAARDARKEAQDGAVDPET